MTQLTKKRFNLHAAVAASASVAAMALAGAAQAIVISPLPQTIVDYSFASTANGSPVPTSTTNLTTYPQTAPYAVGEDAGLGNTYTGTVLVNPLGTMPHAAVMTTTQHGPDDGAGVNYMDSQFSLPVHCMLIDFDICVGDVPTTGLAQATAHAPDGQAFAFNVFDGNSSRSFRFAVAPTDATHGIFGMRNNTDGDLIPFGTYTEGETHHIQIFADYDAKVTDTYLDGSLAVNSNPFVVDPGPTPSLSEIFYFQNGVEGELNQIGLGDLTVTAPEPASLGLLGLAGIGLLTRRRSTKLSV